MNRVWAIIERDLRRFRRSPTLVIVSIVMPLVQLLVLGYAFGGKVKNLQIGVVDEDHGLPAIKLKEMCQAVAANARTFETIAYSDRAMAMRDLRDGKINSILDIPPQFSRRYSRRRKPAHRADRGQHRSIFLLGSGRRAYWHFAAYNAPPVPPRTTASATLSVVEVYPYVPYIQYLLPGTIVLAIFVAAMIGGGIIFIDDKARGLHEGYLVTPIRKFELILGFTLSGAAKAIIAGLVLVTAGSLLAGIPNPFDPLRLARMLFLVVLTSLALISMMFLIMVRVSDPLVPRAIFGLLNTVLFFPSGAVYPTASFPPWMKAITVVDPFTYAVHGFKDLVLKNTGLMAISGDIAFLLGFTILAMGAATLLFRRTL